MKLSCTLVAAVVAASFAEARTWTNVHGQRVDAEVVRVSPDRTVELKPTRGPAVTVPFETFVEEDVRFLEALLARGSQGGWERLNEGFGLAVWQDDRLWDDATAEAATRMELRRESKTAFMENHRAYPLGKRNLLGEPVYAIALYGGENKVESLSFIFLNQGDMPHAGGIVSPNDQQAIAERIEACGQHVHAALVPLLGKPRKDTLGKGDLMEKVWRWDWNGHAILLSTREGKYAALRIMPVDRADRAGRIDKIKEGELKQRMASCVERRPNGDVVIGNIPMVDQGPKGYCVPATWERYLRYMDIPADMYLLALAGNTRIGGGTYTREMVEAAKPLISANGRELETLAGPPTLGLIAPFIDQGLPIIWSFMSTPAFQLAANNATAERQGKPVRKANQAEETSAGGHVCLLVGYNLQTGQIAISDSWGPRFAERWVGAGELVKVSGDGEGMHIIKW